MTFPFALPFHRTAFAQRTLSAIREQETYRILDPPPRSIIQIPTPLIIDLALQIERALLVRHVPRCRDQSQADPEHECIHGKEGPVVEYDAGVADEGSEGAKDCCDGGYWSC